ncbi:MAG: hypothetical protein LUQ65_05575 [Candidatus Helarchaeota archaeon]|nr:hypothetical protein [Candidatus Helarchaeota archaeon]
MVRSARTAGGILAIAGAALMLLAIAWGGSYSPIPLLYNEFNLFCGGLTLLGGILLLTDRGVGGILALIGGISFIILLFIPDPGGGHLTISLFGPYCIDGILAMVGAILGLAVGAEFKTK